MIGTLDEIPQTWSAKAKTKALALINKELNRDPKVWYCPPDRDEEGNLILADDMLIEQHGDIQVHIFIWHEEGCTCGKHARYVVHGPNCDGHPHGEYDYQHARSDQWPPSLSREWSVWLAISGRGAGKTKSGAEWALEMAGRTSQVAIIGRRRKDVVQTMVEGPSGLEVACARAGIQYEWLPSKLEFTLASGHKILGYSAEEPDSLRGPEHGAAWLDEPAHMKLIADVWDNLVFGLRVPGIPGGARIYCTSTPLPTKWLRALIADPDTIVVRVSTYVNLANLDPGFRKRLLDKYEGTRKGRQELEGEVIEDVEGALWEYEMLHRSNFSVGQFDKVVVAIDPAGTANRRSDETGIVVVGRIGDTCYVLADASGVYTPLGWANKALDLVDDWDANEIVAESNFGGDMVKQTIDSAAKDRGESVKVVVKRAQKSKRLRAEPVVARYEKMKVLHNGKFPDLEEEMLTWVPGTGDSPNRVDALVWGVDHLQKLAVQSKTAVPQGKLPSRQPSRSLVGLRPRR